MCRSSAARTICAGWANSLARPPRRRPTTASTTSRSWPRSITPRDCRWPRFCQQAAAFRAAGADLIDLGCDPGDAWPGVGPTVRALVDAGHRVSIDSMNVVEIAAAVRAGAELVLSVNSGNRHAAADWGCEVVAVPDVPATLAGLDETVELLAAAKIPLRIDPILEPIGCGFATSLGRYLDVRRRYPDAEMLMGIGNLTELTDADSAAINVLLLGFCQELSIHSVLTTEVINWARSSVDECDLARRLVYYAVRHRLPPKRLDAGLVMLRDAVVPEFGARVSGKARPRDSRPQLPPVRRSGARSTP